MKKLLMVVAVAGFIATVSSSCKKEYTCECVTTDNGTVVEGGTTTTTAEFKKKSDAEAWCNKSITSGDLKTECKLK